MIESSTLAGKTVKIALGEFEGESFAVEDFACNVLGTDRWIMNYGNPTVLEYLMTHSYYPGATTSALYGKVGMFAHILDFAELIVEGVDK